MLVTKTVVWDGALLVSSSSCSSHAKCPTDCDHRIYPAISKAPCHLHFVMTKKGTLRLEGQGMGRWGGKSKAGEKWNENCRRGEREGGGQ